MRAGVQSMFAVTPHCSLLFHATRVQHLFAIFGLPFLSEAAIQKLQARAKSQFQSKLDPWIETEDWFYFVTSGLPVQTKQQSRDRKQALNSGGTREVRKRMLRGPKFITHRDQEIACRIRNEFSCYKNASLAEIPSKKL